MSKKFMEELKQLVEDKQIIGFEISCVDENGNFGKKSKYANSEILELTFNNSKKVRIKTECSGTCEDTEFADLEGRTFIRGRD